MLICFPKNLSPSQIRLLQKLGQCKARPLNSRHVSCLFLICFFSAPTHDASLLQTVLAVFLGALANFACKILHRIFQYIFNVLNAWLIFHGFRHTMAKCFPH